MDTPKPCRELTSAGQPSYAKANKKFHLSPVRSCLKNHPGIRQMNFLAQSLCSLICGPIIAGLLLQLYSQQEFSSSGPNTTFFFRAHTDRLAINADYSYLSIIQHYFCPCRKAQKFNPRQEQSNPAFVLPSQQQHPQTSFIDYSGYTARQSSAKFHRLFDT